MKSRLVPVLVLGALIAFHGTQIVVRDDDPQRSGAFAMFATVDIGSTRRVLATVPGESVSLEIPAELDSARTDLLDRPAPESARELGMLLLERQWRLSDGTVSSTEEGQSLTHVRIQVVGLVASGRTIERHVLVDLTVGTTS